MSFIGHDKTRRPADLALSIARHALGRGDNVGTNTLAMIIGEVDRLQRIEAAAREVLAVETPHECQHDELRAALDEVTG